MLTLLVQKLPPETNELLKTELASLLLVSQASDWPELRMKIKKFGDDLTFVQNKVKNNNVGLKDLEEKLLPAAESRMTLLRNGYLHVEVTGKYLVRYFAENYDDCNWEQLMSSIAQFVRDFDTASKKIFPATGPGRGSQSLSNTRNSTKSVKSKAPSPTAAKKVYEKPLVLKSGLQTRKVTTRS